MASLLKAKHQETALKMAEEEGLKIASASLAEMESTIWEGSIILYSFLQGYRCIKDEHAGIKHQTPRNVKR